MLAILNVAVRGKTAKNVEKYFSSDLVMIMSIRDGAAAVTNAEYISADGTI